MYNAAKTLYIGPLISRQKSQHCSAGTAWSSKGACKVALGITLPAISTVMASVCGGKNLCTTDKQQEPIDSVIGCDIKD